MAAAKHWVLFYWNPRFILAVDRDETSSSYAKFCLWCCPNLPDTHRGERLTAGKLPPHGSRVNYLRLYIADAQWPSSALAYLGSCEGGVVV